MRQPAPLAASIGDPAGIGPEMLAMAWAGRVKAGLTPFFAVGGAAVLEQAIARLDLAVPVIRIQTPLDAAAAFADGLPVLATADGRWTPGTPCADGARLALDSLAAATELARTGSAGGLVTGPVAKGELARLGFTQPGQTEYVADACGIAHDDAVMMLAGPSLRTVPLTVHCALADVPRLITADLIMRRARIVAAALSRDFGIARPRIAVCGLNPHCGEGGRFGEEEARVIRPAVEALRAEGLAVTGPHAADALFSPHDRAGFDAALAMYHDQALIPIKALDFDAGVNVTLGLPIVRTSADHGTAFALAGTGTAHPGATIAALRMAGQCAARRAGAA